MRHRLAQALQQEPESQASRARERILERGFFGLASTPAPARVVSLQPNSTR